MSEYILPALERQPVRHRAGGRLRRSRVREIVRLLKPCKHSPGGERYRFYGLVGRRTVRLMVPANERVPEIEELESALERARSTGFEWEWHDE